MAFNRVYTALVLVIYIYIYTWNHIDYNSGIFISNYPIVEGVINNRYIIYEKPVYSILII